MDNKLLSFNSMWLNTEEQFQLRITKLEQQHSLHSITSNQELERIQHALMETQNMEMAKAIRLVEELSIANSEPDDAILLQVQQKLKTILQKNLYSYRCTCKENCQQISFTFLSQQSK
ncbi:hypothetical protein C0J52_19767 [Blattella germanica]|nr:hypothetical protein C0J52_19767 [Blattella germanica]